MSTKSFIATNVLHIEYNIILCHVWAYLILIDELRRVLPGTSRLTTRFRCLLTDWMRYYVPGMKTKNKSCKFLPYEATSSHDNQETQHATRPRENVSAIECGLRPTATTRTIDRVSGSPASLGSYTTLDPPATARVYSAWARHKILTLLQALPPPRCRDGPISNQASVVL
jgi:hypothetical protein